MTSGERATDEAHQRAVKAAEEALLTWTATSWEHRASNVVRAIEQAGLAVVPDEDNGISLGAPGVLWMAMRYALGRGTYAVGEACDAVLENLDKLNRWQAARMASEIEQELEWAAEADRQDGVTTHYARDLDERWRATAKALREHAAKETS